MSSSIEGRPQAPAVAKNIFYNCYLDMYGTGMCRVETSEENGLGSWIITPASKPKLAVTLGEPEFAQIDEVSFAVQLDGLFNTSDFRFVAFMMFVVTDDGLSLLDTSDGVTVNIMTWEKGACYPGTDLPVSTNHLYQIDGAAPKLLSSTEFWPEMDLTWKVFYGDYAKTSENA